MLRQFFLGSIPGNWLLIFTLAALGTLLALASWWTYELIARGFEWLRRMPMHHEPPQAVGLTRDRRPVVPLHAWKREHVKDTTRITVGQAPPVFWTDQV
jgi:hypothetical protein